MKPKANPDEDTQKVAETVKNYYKERKKIEKGLTMEKLADEIDRTQSLFSKWLRGSAHIPDKVLIWMGTRLGFDPVKVRPALANALPYHKKNDDRALFISKINLHLHLCSDEEYEHAKAILCATLKIDENN